MKHNIGYYFRTCHHETEEDFFHVVELVPTFVLRSQECEEKSPNGNKYTNKI